jgi:histidyl-tRNA synthetase
LRILDCKVPSCKEARKGAPPVLDYLCPDCKAHFDGLKKHLDVLQVPHTVNPGLVRGLDYYTKTAFEVSSENLGSQSAVAAGGRYDGMVEEFGGPSTPGIGFAMGMERIIPLIKDAVTTPEGPDLFICPLGDRAVAKGLAVAEQLRSDGLWAEVNFDAASVRSQMRKANRINAKRVVIIGDHELASNEITIKNMVEKEETMLRLDAHEITGMILNR